MNERRFYVRYRCLGQARQQGPYTSDEAAKLSDDFKRHPAVDGRLVYIVEPNEDLGAKDSKKLNAEIESGFVEIRS